MIPQQYVVLYGSGRGKVFDTAYTTGQAGDAVLHCIEVHGEKSDPRIVKVKALAEKT